MRLTRFSDYALRTLVFVATQPGDSVTIAEVASAYGISRNHLMKVISMLASGGFLLTVRGSGGGVRLAMPLEEIKLGTVLRFTEGTSALVECLDRKTNTCVIAPACGLRHTLCAALEAFYEKLQEVSLADVTRNPTQLNVLFQKQTQQRVNL